MTMLKLNDVAGALAPAAKVMIAEVEAPAAMVVEVGFQVHVRYVLAPEGVHPLAAMLKVSGMFPVFLM